MCIRDRLRAERAADLRAAGLRAEQPARPALQGANLAPGPPQWARQPTRRTAQPTLAALLTPPGKQQRAFPRPAPTARTPTPVTPARQHQARGHRQRQSSAAVQPARTPRFHDAVRPATVPSAHAASALPPGRARRQHGAMHRGCSSSPSAGSAGSRGRGGCARAGSRTGSGRFSRSSSVQRHQGGQTHAARKGRHRHPPAKSWT